MRTIVNASILVSNDGIRLSQRFVVRVIVTGLILFLLNMIFYSGMVIYYEIKISKMETIISNENRQKGD